MASILIVDDDELLCETLTDFLTAKNHTVTCATTIAGARNASKALDYDVVLLDVRLPDGNGLDIIPDLKKTATGPEVIIMTGQGDPDGAETAIKSGAWCYLEKTFITRELLLPLTRVLQYRQEKTRTLTPKIINRDRIIGNSPLMQQCLQLLANASCSDVNVLITGETGTGKEVFASAIHENSARAAHGNFVVVDCAALPETLVESILFGHVRGAFTGADKQRKGLVRQAHGGTLFLDEVGELPLSVQKSFLRVLEEHRFRPVGGQEEEESDFRLIAATNRDLEKMVEKGTFRMDLLYRLRALLITLPPLRTRGNDIIDLTGYFLNLLSTRYGQERKAYTPDFLEALKLYSWPGNVRELYHALDRVCATAVDSPVYYPMHLPEEIRVELARSSIRGEKRLPGAANAPEKTGTLSTWKEYRNEAEMHYLQKLLTATGRNIAQACRISGLSRARLYQLLNKYPQAFSPVKQKSPD